VKRTLLNRTERQILYDGLVAELAKAKAELNMEGATSIRVGELKEDVQELEALIENFEEHVLES
jgi:hypothetical protein